jgi:hypothetical protein
MDPLPFAAALIKSNISLEAMSFSGIKKCLVFRNILLIQRASRRVVPLAGPRC